jgi:hypothetical protein
MSDEETRDPFAFDDQFFEVPPAAIDADPAETIRGLFDRVNRLEHSLAEERTQAVADMRETLLILLNISDEITNMVERWGVSTSAQQAAIVRNLVEIGRELLDLLKMHRVQPITTLGEPVDPETSDIVGTEERPGTPPNTVVREVQVGYVWPHGLLRRAKVIASEQPADTEPEPEQSQTTAETEEDAPVEDISAQDAPTEEGRDT